MTWRYEQEWYPGQVSVCQDIYEPKPYTWNGRYANMTCRHEQEWFPRQANVCQDIYEQNPYFWKGKTEPFDWLSTEKSIGLPIFEDIASSAQNHNNHTKQSGLASSAHYTIFDSPEYETTFAPTNYAFGDAASSVVPGATQQQLTYAPSFGAGIAMTSNPASPACEKTEPLSPPFVDVDPKREVLTPPDSPKDEDILKLLQEFEPQDWDRLLSPDQAAAAATTTNLDLTFSENTCSNDGFSDDADSNPSYVCSPSSSDNDADYVPTRGGNGGRRKMSGSLVASARRRASKPYSRQSVEERKLRKKEQNKNAATRYRMKKKQEVEDSKNEEKLLADRNRELRSKMDDISREIKCLKSLMRDVFRKQGVIK